MTAGEDVGHWVGRQGVAVSDGRIVAIGDTHDVVAKARQPVEVIDAAGATVTPGLIDSHVHPTWGAELTVGVDLDGLGRAEVLRALRAEASRLPQGAWVRGWNLDYKVFEGQISGEVIEDAVGGRPTALLLYDLHTAVGTRAAMTAAGLTGGHHFDDASEVVLDPTGQPTGELREPPAYSLLLDAAPALSDEERRLRSLAVLRRMNRCGVTGGVVMDGTPKTLRLLESIEADGELPTRLHVALWHRPDTGDDELGANIGRFGTSGRRWSCTLIKIFLDGVIDTGTAWLHEPDLCGQGTHPFWTSIDRYREVVHRYSDAGFQIATHAVGDRAVATVMDAYEGLGSRSAAGFPHRIEHLETLTDDEVARIAASGAIASMQPLHMQWREPDESDSWAARLGHDRAERAFRVGDILRAGGHITLGSDWPVASLDPRLGMSWAQLRRQPGNIESRAFEPSQRLSGYEALLGYTRWAAEALGRTDLGILAVGNRADLTVFASDPAEAAPDELPSIPVLLTMVDGEIVHREGA